MPYIEIGFTSISQPALAIHLCQEVQRALGKSVFFHHLGSDSLAFYLQDDFLLPPGIVYEEGRFEEVGVPVDEIAQAWNLPNVPRPPRCLVEIKSSAAGGAD